MSLSSGFADESMRSFIFALRALRRDWRAGELTVLLLALLVAVASVTSVAFFTDRARLGLQRQANELLAADLAVVSNRPLDIALDAQAQRLGLATARTLGFVSMVLAGGRTQLIEVKAVAPGYPLRGRLRTAAAPFERGVVTEDIPARGAAWLDSRLLSILGLSVGDRINLGDTRLRVARVLTAEPDRGGEVFSIGPRLLMNLADVAATGLIQTGSRVQYRLLLAGPQDGIEAFRARLKPRLDETLQVQDVRQARPEMHDALGRAERFLGLAALVSVILAGIAIAMAARRYSARHLDGAAMMRCLGATQNEITVIFSLQMAVLGLLASALGCALGYLGQEVLIALLRDLLLGPLPPPSWRPIWVGLATGTVTLLGFALPPVLRLKDVAPLRVLRRDLGPPPARAAAAPRAGPAPPPALLLWRGGGAE